MGYQKDLITRLLKEGYSLGAAADISGSTRSWVARVKKQLRRQGWVFPPTPVHYCTRQAPMREAILRYIDSGLPYRAVAERVGSSVGYVQQVFSQYRREQP